VFLKFALLRMPPFGWTRRFWGALLVNWPFAACGICFGIASLLWMYILKHFPLSTAYPMIGFSYVLGMVFAIVFFHETVAPYKWLGVALVIAGCCIIAK